MSTFKNFKNVSSTPLNIMLIGLDGANIVLVFKKDKKEGPGNYKAVSLMSVPSKMNFLPVLELMKNT